mmetsp:Transcript_9699/g.44144  ORF Transcript_9699/g.44144 Transcript_9699/m.44144 type:complete len:297 (+) Transcript_9699:663-1553(+)
MRTRVQLHGRGLIQLHHVVVQLHRVLALRLSRRGRAEVLDGLVQHDPLVFIDGRPVWRWGLARWPWGLAHRKVRAAPPVEPVAQLAIHRERRLVPVGRGPRDLQARAPRRVLVHAGRPRVPEDDQVPPGAGQSDVDPFRGHEAASAVCTAEREDDDVLFLALKGVHGAHLDRAVVLAANVIFLANLLDALARKDPGEVVNNGALLSLVKSDHSNLPSAHTHLDDPRGDQRGEPRLARRIFAPAVLSHVPATRVDPRQRVQRGSVHRHHRATFRGVAPVDELAAVVASVGRLAEFWV